MSDLAETTRQFFSEFDAPLRVSFDAATARVHFCYGPWIVDHCDLGDYKSEFGVVAVRRLLQGEKVSR